MITPDFAAYAVRIDVRPAGPLSSSTVQRQVEGLLTKIAQECMRAGADLIGHIKCIVETKGQGFLAVSVTDAEGRPYSKGHLDEGLMEMDIIVNVLLYGLSRTRIQELVDPLARKELAFPGAEVEVSDLEKPHVHGPGVIQVDDRDHDREHDHR